MNAKVADLSVFIAYRQGSGAELEGDEAAEWLYENLQGRTIAIDGRQLRLNTYWDKAAPAVGDWHAPWKGDLQTARAFVLVTSNSTDSRREGKDYLFGEVEWWLVHRDVAPIIINAGDRYKAPIPPPVLQRWPNVQWINWSVDPVHQERSIGRIVEGITLAETKVRYQELERTMRLLHQAEVARLDALAALNKAESLRLETIENPGAELVALAHKYGTQMEVLADQAAALRIRGPGQPEGEPTGVRQGQPVFALEVLETQQGSCLLVHYGRDQRRFILIDGGPRASYRKQLRPRLEELATKWGTDGRLELEAVISTQADEPESGGLQSLLAELIEDKGPCLDIRRFWTNIFDPFDTYVPGVRPVMSALQVPHYARALGLMVNAPFDRFVSQPRMGAPQIEFADGLSVTVLGPRGAFSQYWVKEVAKAIENRGASHDIDTTNDDVVETVSSPQIYLRPAPVRLPDVEPGIATDMSSRNRTSIVLLLEFEGKRMLLTSDARGDDLVMAAAQAGLLELGDSVLLDLLSVPHYGSKRNVDPSFFRTIKADRYLVQQSVRHKLPHSETIEMLTASRGDERFSVYFTGSRFDARNDLAKSLQKRENCVGVWRDTDATSLLIDLMSDVDTKDSN